MTVTLWMRLFGEWWEQIPWRDEPYWVHRVGVVRRWLERWMAFSDHMACRAYYSDFPRCLIRVDPPRWPGWWTNWSHTEDKRSPEQRLAAMRQSFRNLKFIRPEPKP